MNRAYLRPAVQGSPPPSLHREDHVSGDGRRVSGSRRGSTTYTFHASRITHQASPPPRPVRAFTLLEVMIACGIFFMATFAILALVAGTLRNARGLQRGEVDAGMAAAQIFQLLKTNRQAEISGSGDFGEAYRDYTYEFQSSEFQTNGLLQVDIVVNRRGLRQPVDTLSIWIYAPDAKSGYGTHL